MPTTFLDLILVLFCPLVLSAAAWVIAVKALAWTDEISEVVQALTQPNGDENEVKRGADSSLPLQVAREQARRRKLVPGSQNIKAERARYETNTSVR
jgi:hypothetical protein